MLIWRHQGVYGSTIEMMIDDNGDIVDSPANKNNSNSSKFTQQMTGQTGNSSTKNVEIMVPLKYICNSWRTLEMPLNNFKIM